MVAAAMAGDHRALEALWLENRRWIAAVILAYKPRSEDLDDLLQEVAMTLIAKVQTLREHGNLRAWLRTVAINVARAAGRAERARPTLRLVDGEADQLAIPDADQTGLDDHSQRVLQLARQLPELYREPLLLKALHGMRTRQIAEILDIEEATVDTRISRARQMLRHQAQQQELDTAYSPVVLRPA